MNKKIIVIVVLAIGGLFLLNALGSNRQTNSQTQVQTQPPAKQNMPTNNVSPSPAEKIEVVHFHSTNQCWSCITVGEYALKTIKEKFPEEYGSGKIVFKDINGDLKENQELVLKYQARGSSLFINAIRDDKDEITEDTTVWRLVSNESQFISYFEKKLSVLLDK